MNDMVLVRPRRGLILPGIPFRGAELPKALAETWIADQLVERIEPPVTPAPTRVPAARRRASTPPKAGRRAGPKRRSAK